MRAQFGPGVVGGGAFALYGLPADVLMVRAHALVDHDGALAHLASFWLARTSARWNVWVRVLLRLRPPRSVRFEEHHAAFLAARAARRSTRLAYAVPSRRRHTFSPAASILLTAAVLSAFGAAALVAFAGRAALRLLCIRVPSCCQARAVAAAPGRCLWRERYRAADRSERAIRGVCNDSGVTQDNQLSLSITLGSASFVASGPAALVMTAFDHFKELVDTAPWRTVQGPQMKRGQMPPDRARIRPHRRCSAAVPRRHQRERRDSDRDRHMGHRPREEGRTDRVSNQGVLERPEREGPGQHRPRCRRTKKQGWLTRDGNE